MLDANWHNYERIARNFAPIHTGEGQVATVVYDLVPLLHPEVCSADVLEHFRTWLLLAASNSDLLICISQSVAIELETYLLTHTIERRPNQKITWFQLGSDVSPIEQEGSRKASAIVSNTRTELIAYLRAPRKTFLMVGTIEPRKRHVLALDAMEKLWQGKGDCQLLFIGREGWKVEEFAKRLRKHGEAGKRLLWISDANDAEIEFAYRHSSALLFPSLYEGYGLPVVEAMRENLPVIASDLPVLREIAGDYPSYIEVDDIVSLQHAIEAHLSSNGAAIAAGSERAHVSWQDSGEQLSKHLSL